MKDDLSQGNWDLKMPENFSQKPTEKIVKPEPKAEEQKEEVKEEQSKATGKKKQKQKNQKKEQPKKETVEFDFDLCDFPLPYSRPELVQNWFDFNDSTVRPIMPGTLQTTFGGNSENAYMLIYRQKQLNDGLQIIPDIPSYWKPEIEKLSQLYHMERQNYEDLTNQLEIVIQDKEAIFSVQSGDFVQYIQDAQFEE